MSPCSRLVADCARGNHTPLDGGGPASLARGRSRLATCRWWSPSEPARPTQHDWSSRRRLCPDTGHIEARSVPISSRYLPLDEQGCERHLGATLADYEREPRPRRGRRRPATARVFEAHGAADLRNEPPPSDPSLAFTSRTSSPTLNFSLSSLVRVLHWLRVLPL